MEFLFYFALFYDLIKLLQKCLWSRVLRSGVFVLGAKS